MAGFTIDATERKQLEARKAELEAEGYLLQKAESLGLICLLYTSDAADERSSVDLGGRRIIKKKKKWK